MFYDGGAEVHIAPGAVIVDDFGKSQRNTLKPLEHFQRDMFNKCDADSSSSPFSSRSARFAATQHHRSDLVTPEWLLRLG